VGYLSSIWAIVGIVAFSKLRIISASSVAMRDPAVWVLMSLKKSPKGLWALDCWVFCFLAFFFAPPPTFEAAPPKYDMNFLNISFLKIILDYDVFFQSKDFNVRSNVAKII
jgi:hypothetical protein